MSLTISNVRVGDRGGLQVRLHRGRISEISSRNTATTDHTIDAQGGTLLPGLWDHHVHLRATAAQRISVQLGRLTSYSEVVQKLRQAKLATPVGGWIRAVGYDDNLFGPLDARQLDRSLGTKHPIRVQHRSGHAWFLNSLAVDILTARSGTSIARDGVLYDADHLLSFLPPQPGNSAAVRQIAKELSAYGVTGATEMTPTLDATGATQLSHAVEEFIDLKFHGKSGQGFHLAQGGTKVLIAEHDLPELTQLQSRIAASRPGAVALHTVTRESLMLALLAMTDQFRPGDRIEHALLTPRGYPEIAADLFADLAGMPQLCINPGFVATQGERLLRDLEPADLADYQRNREWLDAGFTLLGGSDSPYGPLNPWISMDCAVTRKSPTGKNLDNRQKLEPEQAFALFTRDGLRSNHPKPLELTEGSMADLCIIDTPWEVARENLASARVTATIRRGDPS